MARRIGPPPERVDLVYSFRPLSELPEIVALAGSLHAGTVWTQSGMSASGIRDARGCWVPDTDLLAARSLVESAGLAYISEPYIADVARELSPPPTGPGT